MTLERLHPKIWKKAVRNWANIVRHEDAGLPLWEDSPGQLHAIEQRHLGDRQKRRTQQACRRVAWLTSGLLRRSGAFRGSQNLRWVSLWINYFGPDETEVNLEWCNGAPQSAVVDILLDSKFGLPLRWKDSRLQPRPDTEYRIELVAKNDPTITLALRRAVRSTNG